MKKIRLLSFACLILFISLEAHTKQKHWSAAIGFGGGQMEDETLPTTGTTPRQYQLSFDTGLAWRIEARQAFYNQFALGLQFAQHIHDLKRFNIQTSDLANTSNRFTGEVRLSHVFASFYYLPNIHRGSSLQPYSSLGLGTSQIDYAGITQNNQLVINDKAWNFAYHILAGINYRISPTFSFELEYRYSNIRDSELVDTQDNTLDISAKTSTFTLGIRVNFF